MISPSPSCSKLLQAPTPSISCFTTIALSASIMTMLINMVTTMITEVSAVKFRQNLGEMLTQVQYRHDSVLISKDGKPVAALIDAGMFQRIRRMQERFDALANRLEAAYTAVPDTVGESEIMDAIRAERNTSTI